MRFRDFKLTEEVIGVANLSSQPGYIDAVINRAVQSGVFFYKAAGNRKKKIGKIIVLKQQLPLKCASIELRNNFEVVG